jgi:hypothetical protein
MAGCGKCGDEPSGSGAMELVVMFGRVTPLKSFLRSVYGGIFCL